MLHVAIRTARPSDLSSLSEVTANPHADAFYAHAGFQAGGSVDTALGAGARMALRLAPPG